MSHAAGEAGWCSSLVLWAARGVFRLLFPRHPPLAQVPELGSIDANDLDADAVAAMKRNVELNGGEAAAKIRVLRGDARMTMMQNPGVSEDGDGKGGAEPGFHGRTK